MHNTGSRLTVRRVMKLSRCVSSSVDREYTGITKLEQHQKTKSVQGRTDMPATCMLDTRYPIHQYITNTKNHVLRHGELGFWNRDGAAIPRPASRQPSAIAAALRTEACRDFKEVTRPRFLSAWSNPLVLIASAAPSSSALSVHR